eukprot:GHVS01060375.1.p1 GENE.GHVS01060375.1~~GHVS01060375.1.p1  ORF type:complete len:967 (+),score=310.75 GHVS01060375.1:1706-4606(+)
MPAYPKQQSTSPPGSSFVDDVCGVDGGAAVATAKQLSPLFSNIVGSMLGAEEDVEVVVGHAGGDSPTRLEEWQKRLLFVVPPRTGKQGSGVTDATEDEGVGLYAPTTSAHNNIGYSCCCMDESTKVALTGNGGGGGGFGGESDMSTSTAVPIASETDSTPRSLAGDSSRAAQTNFSTIGFSPHHSQHQLSPESRGTEGVVVVDVGGEQVVAAVAGKPDNNNITTGLTMLESSEMYLSEIVAYNNNRQQQYNNNALDLTDIGQQQQPSLLQLSTTTTTSSTTSTTSSSTTTSSTTSTTSSSSTSSSTTSSTTSILGNREAAYYCHPSEEVVVVSPQFQSCSTGSSPTAALAHKRLQERSEFTLMVDDSATCEESAQALQLPGTNNNNSYRHTSVVVVKPDSSSGSSSSKRSAGDEPNAPRNCRRKGRVSVGTFECCLVSDGDEDEYGTKREKAEERHHEIIEVEKPNNQCNNTTTTANNNEVVVVVSGGTTTCSSVDDAHLDQLMQQQHHNRQQNKLLLDEQQQQRNQLLFEDIVVHHEHQQQYEQHQSDETDDLLGRILGREVSEQSKDDQCCDGEDDDSGQDDDDEEGAFGNYYFDSGGGGGGSNSICVADINFFSNDSNEEEEEGSVGGGDYCNNNNNDIVITGVDSHSSFDFDPVPPNFPRSMSDYPQGLTSHDRISHEADHYPLLQDSAVVGCHTHRRTDAACRQFFSPHLIEFGPANSYLVGRPHPAICAALPPPPPLGRNTAAVGDKGEQQQQQQELVEGKPGGGARRGTNFSQWFRGKRTQINTKNDANNETHNQQQQLGVCSNNQVSRCNDIITSKHEQQQQEQSSSSPPSSSSHPHLSNPPISPYSPTAPTTSPSSSLHFPSPRFLLCSGGAAAPRRDKAVYGGEDAFFFDNASGTAGVADGVGAWASHGSTAGPLAMQLMAKCREEAVRKWAELENGMKGKRGCCDSCSSSSSGGF